MEHEGGGDTICSRRPRYSNRRIGKMTGGLRDKNMCEDYLNYCIIEIGENTENYPGDRRDLMSLTLI